MRFPSDRRRERNTDDNREGQWIGFAVGLTDTDRHNTTHKLGPTDKHDNCIRANMSMALARDRHQSLGRPLSFLSWLYITVHYSPYLLPNRGKKKYSFILGEKYRRREGGREGRERSVWNKNHLIWINRFEFLNTTQSRAQNKFKWRELKPNNEYKGNTEY